MQRFVLHITRACNLSCSYCYERDKTSKDPEENILKENMDIIIDLIEKSKKRPQIEFIGGEPLLRPDLISFCCEYMNKNCGGVVKYMTTTNATIVDEKNVSVLNKYNIELIVSLDGNKFMHNCCRVYKSNRKGTYDDVVKGIEVLKNTYSRDLVIQLTTHRHNISHLYEGVRSIYNLGIKKINIGVVFKSADIDFFDKYKEQHVLILENLDEFEGLTLTPIMAAEKGFTTSFSIKKEKDSSVIDSYKEVDINEEKDIIRIKNFKTIEELRNLYFSKYKK